MTKSKAQQFEDQMDNCPCEPDEWVGRVQAGDPATGPGFSTWVCNLSAHRNAAEGYAEATFPGLPIQFIPAEDR